MTTVTARQPRWPVAVLCLAAVALPAGADEIRIGGQWYTNVSVRGIAAGRVTRVNAAGTEIRTPLARVEAIRIDAHPDLARAQDAVAAGNPRAAAGLLEPLARRVREPWLRAWVTYRWMTAAAGAGEADATVRALADLARRKADGFYFADPPVSVFASVDEALLRRLRGRLTASRRAAGPEAAAAIKAMLAAASERAAMLTTPPKPAPAPAAATGAAGPMQAPPAKSAVTLPRVDGAGDPIDRLLRAGAFEAAAEQLDRLLETSPKYLARHLYQRGVARLGMAGQRDDADLYRSAGLDFMRVVFYRPKATTYVGASLMEAGYVHHKIGRDDLARGLFDRARLSIRAKEQPELTERLNSLSALVAAGN